MVVGARHRILRGVCRARHANYERESMIRAPLLRSRPSIPRVSGIAERWDCVRQIYGLTTTRLAEPVRCVTEGSVGVPAYEVQCAWLAKTVDCVVNGKSQETPSQGWKTFLRNHAEWIASIGLFVVRKDYGGIPGSYAMLEVVVHPNHPNHAEAKPLSS